MPKPKAQAGRYLSLLTPGDVGLKEHHAPPPERAFTAQTAENRSRDTEMPVRVGIAGGLHAKIHHATRHRNARAWAYPHWLQASAPTAMREESISIDSWNRIVPILVFQVAKLNRTRNSIRAVGLDQHGVGAKCRVNEKCFAAISTIEEQISQLYQFKQSKPAIRSADAGRQTIGCQMYPVMSNKHHRWRVL